MQSTNVKENIANGLTGGVFGVNGAETCRQFQEIAVKQSRLKIPLLFGLDVIHGYETIFPIPLAQASSWNMELIEKGARISANEATASGINWVFSPMLDICRDPRWGRIAEGPGEDPYLGGEIAKAMIKGYQGDDLRNANTVMTCVKHFALYGGAEGGRDYNTVDMSRQRMFNEYMEPYKAAVEVGAGSFMASFNEFEGIPVTANKYLLTDVLRNKWGFDGFVVSDYTGVMEMVMHGIGDYATVAARAIAAGCDMDMVSSLFVKTLKKSLQKGIVSQEQIDKACRRILEAKYKLGLFEDPYKYCNTKRENTEVYTSANRALAREMAAESMVLLKNSGNTLPIVGSAKKIALVGPLANSAVNMPGMWTVFTAGKRKPVTLLQGLKNAVGDRLAYAKGCHAMYDSIYEKTVTPGKLLDRDGRSNEQLLKEALDIAAQSDVIVAAMGELSEMSGEGTSRADITIPAAQQDLLRELQKTGKPIVLVLFTGRPLVLTWENENIPAILNVWFAGSEAGDAIADVLLGKVSPSGKLPVSFPYHIGQIPVFYNHKNTGRPMPDGQPYVRFRSNYLDIPNTPLYPFGFGLSYTHFDYSDIRLSASEISATDEATASVTITNSGQCDGKEIVELYIHDLQSSSTRPVKELKAFKKIFLKAGESKTVEFKIDTSMLKYYNHDLEYVCEPGEFDIMIGGSSDDLKTSRLVVKD